MAQIAFVRESEFAEYIRYADEQELVQQAELLRQELTRFSNVRSRVSELFRDRLNMIEQALGLA